MQLDSRVQTIRLWVLNLSARHLPCEYGHLRPWLSCPEGGGLLQGLGLLVEDDAICLPYAYGIRSPTHREIYSHRITYISLKTWSSPMRALYCTEHFPFISIETAMRKCESCQTTKQAWQRNYGFSTCGYTGSKGAAQHALTQKYH